jgi:hypothetical protein
VLPRSKCNCINSETFVQYPRWYGRSSGSRRSRKEERVIANRNLATTTPLQRDILKVLAYFDIFGHPLSREELYHFLPSDSTTPEKIAELCLQPPLNAFVVKKDGYFSLSKSGNQLGAERREKEKIAAGHLSLALRVAAIVKCFPFVRAIFISGELSKGVATSASDIDFLIITAANRLWLCRSFFPLFKRTLPKRLKSLLCFNTFITEESLTFTQHNIYTATELVTLRPLYVSNNLHQRLFDENKWVFCFFPNYPQKRELAAPIVSVRRTSRLPKILQILLDRLDSWLLQQWKYLIMWKFSHLPGHKREELFICTKGHATGYSRDHATRILNEYNDRVRQLMIELEKQ